MRVLRQRQLRAARLILKKMPETRGRRGFRCANSSLRKGFLSSNLNVFDEQSVGEVRFAYECECITSASFRLRASSQRKCQNPGNDEVSVALFHFFERGFLSTSCPPSAWPRDTAERFPGSTTTKLCFSHSDVSVQQSYFERCSARALSAQQFGLDKVSGGSLEEAVPGCIFLCGWVSKALARPAAAEALRGGRCLLLVKPRW